MLAPCTDAESQQPTTRLDLAQSTAKHHAGFTRHSGQRPMPILQPTTQSLAPSAFAAQQVASMRASWDAPWDTEEKKSRAFARGCI